MNNLQLNCKGDITIENHAIAEFHIQESFKILGGILTRLLFMKLTHH
jgi:hypothetical protein